MFVGNTINYPGGQAATVPTGIYATLSGNAGFIVRTNVNYSTDAYPDGIQGYGAGVNNSGVFGRNIDAGGIGVIGVAPVAPLRRGAGAVVEDFGTATLSGRTAHVSLDADFAAVINPNDYYLFLTEQDEHLGLAVTNRGPTGFTVTASAAVALAQGKGLASVHGTFQYRIVARHKDVAANRFAKAEIAKPIAPPAAPAKPPTAPAPSLPTLPVPRKMHTD